MIRLVAPADLARELETDLGDTFVDFGALSANPSLEEAPIVSGESYETIGNTLLEVSGGPAGSTCWWLAAVSGRGF